MDELLLGENEIKCCKIVSSLTSLRTLSLKTNPIQVLPLGFSKLVNIESVSFKDIKLRGLPLYSVEEWRYLLFFLTRLTPSVTKKMDLSENHLNYLPDCWHSYSRLVTLNLEVNHAFFQIHLLEKQTQDTTIVDELLRQLTVLDITIQLFS